MIRGGSMVLAAAAFVLAAAPRSSAQEGPPRPRTQPADDGLLNNEIDDLLQRWHQKTKDVKQLYTEFRRTVVDAAFKTTRVNAGKARFRDPNLARMDIAQNEKKQGREIFILSEQPRKDGTRGLEIRHYLVAEKKLQIHEFPTDAVRNAHEEGPLRLLFGIKPENAHARYSFTILQKTKEAIAVRVTPKMEQDRQEFLEAILVLDQVTFMPRRLKVKENQDTDVTYDFTLITTNVDTPDLEVLLTDFNPPNVDEKDWDVTRERHPQSKVQGQANGGGRSGRP